MVAAKKLFAKKGFDGTSVKELAEEAGVNVSLVSYYFGGKEGLYMACLENYSQNKFAVVDRILKPPATYEEMRLRLRMLLDEKVEAFFQEPELTRIIHRDLELENSLTEEVFRRRFLVVFERMLSFIQAAQKKGFFRKDLDTCITVRLLFDAITQIIRTDSLVERLTGDTLRNRQYREKVLDHVISVYLEGVAPRKE